MIAEYNYPQSDLAKEVTRDFHESVNAEKASSLPKRSPLTTPFPVQVYACIVRQYQIIWGDKTTFIIKQVVTLIQALIAGSLFYNAPDTSAGLFTKGGALFFSILFHSLLALSEVTSSFEGQVGVDIY